MASKRALITGITGQDGSYLAELLLEKGYEVVGVVRRSSAENFERIEHLIDRLELRQAEICHVQTAVSGYEFGSRASRVRVASNF